MTTDTDVPPVVGALYDAALEPARWTDALQALAQALSANAVAVEVTGRGSAEPRLVLTYGTEPEWTARWRAAFSTAHPLSPSLQKAALDEPVTLRAALSDSVIRETRFYKDWCQPQTYHDMASAVFVRSSAEVGTVLLFRTASEPPFGEPDCRRLQRLLPHLRRSVTIATLLGHRSADALRIDKIVHHLSTAVVVIDAASQILMSNPAADRLLKLGAVVQCCEGQLSFCDPRADRLISAHILSRHRRPVIVPCAVAPADPKERAAAVKARLSAAVLPLDPDGKAFAVLLNELEPGRPAAGRPIADAFGLTPREISVLMTMIQGLSVSEAAEALGISVSTARTHVQNLFEKTGTSRQAELVRVVMQAMPPADVG